MNRNRGGHQYVGSHQHQHQQQPAYHANYAYHNPHNFQHQNQHHEEPHHHQNQHHDDHHHHHTGHHSLSYTPTTRSSDISSRSSKYRRQPRGCGYKCLRGFFSSCNFVFWLLGCAVLGAGIWLHFSKSEYHAVLPISSNDYLCSATLAIAAGATVLVIGFLGCCGSLMQIRCMLLAYFIIVMMLVLIECGIGLMGFAYKDEIDLSVKQELKKTIAVAKRAGQSPDEEAEEDQRIKKAWDSLQRDWRCCGVDDYNDWTGTPKSSFGEKVIMAYSAHQNAREHHSNRGTKKHHHHHRSPGGKHRREEVLFIPDSCCRVEKKRKGSNTRRQQQQQHLVGGVGSKRKKKKDAADVSAASSSSSGLSCASGVPVSHLKKLIADSSSSPPSDFDPPIHVAGCYSGLKSWFVVHQATFSYSILGLAVLQFLGLLAAMMLFCVLGEYGRFW